MGYAEPAGQGPGESSFPCSLADSISAPAADTLPGTQHAWPSAPSRPPAWHGPHGGTQAPGTHSKILPCTCKSWGFFSQNFFFSFILWGKTFFQAFEPGTGCVFLITEGILELEILFSLLLN